MENQPASLADVVAILDGYFPRESAQSWDSVGLVTGDPTQPVTSVLFAVDPALSVIEEAVRDGHNLLVTHHPLLLRGVKSVATTSGKGRAVTSLVVGDVALYCAHTNADVAEGGVNDALARAVGMLSPEPLAIVEGQPLGRIGNLAQPTTLRDFTHALAKELPGAPVGIRVSGEPDARIERVAVLGGAGDSEFAAARDGGADVYVTADLRHHPALEAREEVGAKPLNLIDAGHWATESLWLHDLAVRLQDDLARSGKEIDVTVSQQCTDPWDFVVATGEELGHEG